MFAATIFFTVTTFHFAGGSDSDLAATIAKVMPGESVVLLADPERTWKPYKHEFETQSTLLDTVGKKFALKLEPGQTAVSLGAYPRTVAFYNSYHLQGQTEEPRLKDVKSCETPFATKGAETLSMKQLEKLLPGYSVKWHWFYGPARFAVSSRGMSPDAFITAIAKTLGAEAKITDKSVDFEPDYKMLRRRVRLSIAVRLHEEVGAWDRADLAFMDATWEAATSKQIERGLSNQDQIGEQIPFSQSSRLGPLLQQRFQVRLDPKTSSPVEIEKWQKWLAEIVDINQPATATLSPLMTPSATLRCQKPNTFFKF